MSVHGDTSSFVGAAVGLAAGIYQAIHNTQISLFGIITYANVIETALYALVGSLVGYIGTQLWKYLHKKIKDNYDTWKSKKT